jgi:DNA-binding protein HU-beta
MTKAELIKSIASELGITQTDTGSVLDSFVRAISKALRKDGRFELSGFGVFKVVLRAPATRVNPQDRSKTIHTPAHHTVRFPLARP